MEALSIFDIFKIGVGPSSSHTLGPWRAALHFMDKIMDNDIDKIQIHLYGSLSKTGKGHATDKAVMLGLLGYDPVTIDTNAISEIINNVNDSKNIKLNAKDIHFDVDEDIIFEGFEHKRHPNTLKFSAFLSNGTVLEEWYASVGGGFIEPFTGTQKKSNPVSPPYTIHTSDDILKISTEKSCSISSIVLTNELAFRTQEEIDANIDFIYDTILDCTFTGCSIGGVLPGCLNVARRSKNLSEKLLGRTDFDSREEWLNAIVATPNDFHAINKWISCFALAVNEQNAAMGRVVTSPTNGAAGVIPAVLLYYMLFCDNKGKEDIKKFFLTAGIIGTLFKKGATISAAVGGCQAEIGVSSAMAAAGLTEVMGGTPAQCLMAAEIAMEHHLGLTCDPIAGLVQVPCIERNAIGANKAITSSNLALMSDSEKAIIKLDTVIKVMWETAQDMNHKYKETSEGGLAINLPVAIPNC